MTFEFVIREICLNLDSESAIREVLAVATDERMITWEQAAELAKECNLSSPSSNHLCLYQPDCKCESQDVVCGHCAARKYFSENTA